MNDTTGIDLYRLRYCINKIYILPVKMIFSELDRGTFVYMHLYAKWYSKINLISRRLIEKFHSCLHVHYSISCGCGKISLSFYIP